MKIAICAICKNENLYLREWVEYHKSIGIDNIILYDNNEECGEFPHQVIFDYILSGYVIVHNIRGKIWKGIEVYNNQINIFNKCLEKYRDEFDWIAFIDVDEFIEIESESIHHIFNQYNFQPYDSIILSWQNIGDTTLFPDTIRNNISDRFIQEIPDNNKAQSGIDNTWVKSIVNTKTTKKMSSPHCLEQPICCCAWGGQVWFPESLKDYSNLIEPIHKVMYIKHYCIKSFAEFLCRRKLWGRETNMLDVRVYEYQKFIGWSDEHQRMLDTFVEYVNNPE